MGIKGGGGNPLFIFWMTVAVILGVSGMAGYADRHVHWVGVFGQLNEAYQLYLSSPLVSVISSICSFSWCDPSSWLADYLVLCVGLFVVINISWRSNMGRTLIVDAFRDSGPIGAPIFLLFMFLLTPIFLPFSIILYESLNHEGKVQVRMQLRFYGLMVAIVVVMAVVNYGLRAFLAG
jgi:hypothetical protein